MLLRCRWCTRGSAATSPHSPDQSCLPHNSSRRFPPRSPEDRSNPRTWGRSDLRARTGTPRHTRGPTWTPFFLHLPPLAIAPPSPPSSRTAGQFTPLPTEGSSAKVQGLYRKSPRSVTGILPAGASLRRCTLSIDTSLGTPGGAHLVRNR